MTDPALNRNYEQLLRQADRMTGRTSADWKPRKSRRDLATCEQWSRKFNAAKSSTGFSIAQMVKYFGVSKSTICHWISGTRPPEKARRVEFEQRLAALNAKPSSRPPKMTCWRGHLYTPETTGTRILGGKQTRKCLVCEGERHAAFHAREEARKQGRALNLNGESPQCGKLSTYRKGCRCPPCRAANADARMRQRLKGEADERPTNRPAIGRHPAARRQAEAHRGNPQRGSVLASAG